MGDPSDVTRMLQRWSRGDQKALDQLVPLVYEELKGLAHARLRSERPDHTLNTTGLVHEAYLRLVDVNRVQWRDRGHFLAVASRMMRRVLVDHARKQKAKKRGGSPGAVAVGGGCPILSEREAETLLDLDDALTRLEANHPRQEKVLELYYFGGLTQTEIGDTLDISQPTVSEDLRFARAWIANAWGISRGDQE